jgi:hypothetical protein
MKEEGPEREDRTGNGWKAEERSCRGVRKSLNIPECVPE